MGTKHQSSTKAKHPARTQARPRKTKSFKDKLRPELQPECKPDPKHGDRLLIPTPMLVDAQVRKVRKGKLITPTQIRERLATEHEADRTCPLCTGIFLNIVAGAAEEDLAAGRKRVTPYWRVIKENGALCHKFPPGLERQTELLTAEGHEVVPPPRGKVPRVADFERRLVRK